MVNKLFGFNKKNKEGFPPIYFILPSFLGCLIFIFCPSFCSFLLSFSSWDLISNIEFVGFENYYNLITSYEFWFVLKNTIFYAFCVSLFAVLIPILLAFFLVTNTFMKEFFKTSYFLPFITPMVVIALVWQWFFDPNIGFINTLLKTNIKWLYDVSLAMPILIFVSVWKLIGYNMIIFLSGFSSFNMSIFDSAKVDGANQKSLLFDIVLPLLSPTIFFVVLITIISSFQVFDLIYLMTQGGPNNSTNVLVYWLYSNAFELFNIGKASSIAYVLFILIFVLTLIQWKIRKKWVLNENED